MSTILNEEEKFIIGETMEHCAIRITNPHRYEGQLFVTEDNRLYTVVQCDRRTFIIVDISECNRYSLPPLYAAKKQEEVDGMINSEASHHVPIILAQSIKETVRYVGSIQDILINPYLQTL